MRTRRANGERSADLGRAFGVSQSMVCLVCVGLAYREAGGPLTRRRMRGTLGERIAALTVPGENPDACHGWLGRLSGDGYALIAFGGRTLQVHKHVLERKLGRKLADDEMTRHTCHVRHCTNERHLIPGSSLDNAHDMIAAGRNRYGMTASCRTLSEQDVLDIRERAGIGPVNYEALGRLHGVSGACIKKVILGKTWRHLLPGALPVQAARGAA